MLSPEILPFPCLEEYKCRDQPNEILVCFYRVKYMLTDVSQFTGSVQTRQFNGVFFALILLKN